MAHAWYGRDEVPASAPRSEVAMVCGIAQATLPDSGIDWALFEDDYRLIREKIEAVFPALFRDFNQRIREPGGFHLTVPPRDRVWTASA